MFRMTSAMLMAAFVAPVAAASDAPDSRTHLLFALEPQQTSYVLYETITVPYRISNPTSGPIKAAFSPDIQFFVIDSGGQKREYPTKQHCSGIAENSYSPGTIGTSEIDINGSWIGSPGRYQIQAKVFVGGETYVDSNAIQIEVLTPSTMDRQMIASFPSEDDFVRLLRNGVSDYCRGTATQGCFERLNATLRHFPTAAYAPALTRDLADAVASGSVLKVNGRYDVAVGLFRRFLEQWPNHPSASRVMYRLAMVLDEAGRYDEATSTIQQFMARFPGEKDKIESLRVNFKSGQR